MTWRNPVKILKGAHKLMVGEFFSFSKVYFMCYVYFQKEFLYKLILLSFKGKYIVRKLRRNPFNQNFWKLWSKTEWIGSVQLEKF